MTSRSPMSVGRSCRKHSVGVSLAWPTLRPWSTHTRCSSHLGHFEPQDSTSLNCRKSGSSSVSSCPLNHSPRTPEPHQRGCSEGDGRGEQSSSFCIRTGRSRCDGTCFSVPKSDLAPCTPLANLQPPAWPLGVKAPSPEIRAPRRHHLSPRSWLWKQMFLVTCRGFIVESQPWDTVSGLGVPPTPARHLPASSLFSLGTILQVAGHPFL